MAAEYSRGLLRVCVAQLCQSLGWNAIQSTPLELMTDILERYLIDLGKTTQRYCEQFGRLDPNLDDLGLAFFHLGIPLGELEEYVRHLDPVLFAHDVVSFPVAKSNNLQFPNPKSREIQQEREEHIPDHLPYMYPGMEAEPGDQNQTPIHPSEEPSNSQDDKGTLMEVSPVASGEKRAVSSPGDGLPSKRMRLSSSNLPEEAGHSQYEMMSVTMSQTGHLTPTRGQGKLPDARTPPPGLCQPISSGEPDRRKKDSERDRERSKIKDKHKKALSRSDGDRLGSPIKTGHPNEKENLSDDLKARLKSMKTFDAKKFKKDTSKRTGPLKSFKFGKPLFKTSKSKNIGTSNSSSIQEMLFSDPLNMGNRVDGKVKMDKDKQKVKKKHSGSSQHPELERLMMSGDGIKAVKSTDTESEREKSAQPAATWDPTAADTSDDSDDELSEDDSPVRRLVIAETEHAPRDTEMRKKERLRRIDDILDSVIKSSMAESDESSSFSETPVEAPKEQTPCVTPKSKNKDKDKEKSKQKLSSGKSTSSLDMDACINTVVRQSAEESNKKDVDTTCTSEKDTCSDRPKIVSPNSGNKKQKIKKKLKTKIGKPGKGLNKVREKLKEKIKSRSISQDSSELESESSIKPEKVYPPQYGIFDFPPDSPEESGPLAPLHPPAAPPTQQTESPIPKSSPPLLVSPEKSTPSEENVEISAENKTEESAPSVEPLKIDISKEKIKHKERSKEKEHKKDRKDKKKDKEKKKKNKDKGRDKSKDREKKEKHRDKLEREDKSDGSVPMTIPKLKLKIGGISVGGASSKSVTIATNSGIPKDRTPSPDEIKPAPIRPEIPRLVIKPVPRRPVTDSPVKAVVSPSPVKPSPPAGSRPAPPPGFKAIPESEPVTKTESSLSPPKPASGVLSPPQTVSSQPHKDEAFKSSPPKSLPPPTPPMLPKFRPIPPVSSSPPPVRNIISPPSPPPPAPVKEETPPKPEPSPKVSPPPSPPIKAKSPSLSPSPPPPPPPPKEEPAKSPEKPKPQTPPRPEPPIFYPAPPRRTASLSPRSRELPLYSGPPPKRKNSSPRGRKPSSPGRSNVTPPKRKASTTSPGRKKGSPKGPKKKPSLSAAAKGNLSSPPPSTFTREEEHPSFAPAKPVVKSSLSFNKEETPSPAPSPTISPSPSPPPNPKSGQSGLPPPPPPSKPQPVQRAVFAETVGTSAVSTWDETGQRIWICPTCKLPDDGSPMIGCDRCDEWYHWPCVSIVEPPPEDEDWFCPKCKALQAKVKGKGKGAKRGRKKKVK